MPGESPGMLSKPRDLCFLLQAGGRLAKCHVLVMPASVGVELQQCLGFAACRMVPCLSFCCIHIYIYIYIIHVYIYIYTYV